MNKLIIMGRLVADPEVRAYGDGKQLATFTLAVDRRLKKEGEADADFFRCVCFGKQAETAERYFRKGLKICLDGEIHNNNYTDKEGNRRSDVQVTMNSFEFCERLNVPGQEPASKPAKKKSDGFMHIPDDLDGDDLPFN